MRPLFHYYGKHKHRHLLSQQSFYIKENKKWPTVFCKTSTNHWRRTTWNSSITEIFKSQFLQSLQWWSESTNWDKVQGSFSQCLIAASLKTTNNSTPICCHLTAMKVEDYCLVSWSHSLVVLHRQTTHAFAHLRRMESDIHLVL